MRLLRMEEGLAPDGEWRQFIDGEEVRPLQWHTTKARSLAFYDDTKAKDEINNATLHRYIALVHN